MPITVKQSERDWIIRIDGQATLASAGKNLQLDLEGAEDIDIPVMQLLWVAAREAALTGVEITCRASRAAAAALRDSGFAQDPGFPVFGEGHE